jgi:hypothetical protein
MGRLSNPQVLEGWSRLPELEADRPLSLARPKRTSDGRRKHNAVLRLVIQALQEAGEPLGPAAVRQAILKTAGERIHPSSVKECLRRRSRRPEDLFVREASGYRLRQPDIGSPE